MLATAWAAAASAQQAGREPVTGLPSAGGTTIIDREHPVTATGTLRLWRAASSEGARVMLKVYRPDGDRLLLVGTSPLEVVAAGELATFPCSVPVVRGDLIGCFCPDSSCLDAFADGEVWSAPGDVGTAPLGTFAGGVGTPALFAAGSVLAAVPSASGTELVVPVVARTPGANGTVWSTRLELMNPGDRPAEVALLFNLGGADNTIPAATADLVIEPRSTVTVDDLMAEAFDLTEATGSLDVVSTAPLFGHARIANLGGAVGSYGQSVPALPAAWSLADEEVAGTDPASATARLFGCREGVDFRSNLGVASTGASPGALDVTARIGPQAVGTPLHLELPPHSHLQVNRILRELQVASGASGVHLEVAPAAGSRGRFIAYLSEVDNLSGDAVFLLGDHVPALPWP